MAIASCAGPKPTQRRSYIGVGVDIEEFENVLGVLNEVVLDAMLWVPVMLRIIRAYVYSAYCCVAVYKKIHLAQTSVRAKPWSDPLDLKLQTYDAPWKTRSGLVTSRVVPKPLSSSDGTALQGCVCSVHLNQMGQDPHSLAYTI